jgi:peptide deformylase
MALLPIIVAPDPRLKQVAKPVEKVDEETRRFMQDLLETMYNAPGIGLAAPQVGRLSRIIVTDIAKSESERAPLMMANPTITAVSDDDAAYEEGCLSLPDHYAEVVRPAWAEISYLDETGAQKKIEADGLLATCLQHEIDHLDGILFVDHVSALKRNMILRKLLKAKKAGRYDPEIYQVAS